MIGKIINHTYKLRSTIGLLFKIIDIVILELNNIQNLNIKIPLQRQIGMYLEIDRR